MSDSGTPHTPPPQVLPGEAAAAKSEYPCPDCGELVREGLVRCWNCGSFLKSEMEATYRKMRANPAPIIFSPVAEEEQASVDDFLLTPSGSGSADDEDFALSGPGMKRSPDAAPEAASTAAASTDGEEASDRGAPQAAEGQEDTQVPHSIATGGDALLQVALQEEAESLRRQLQKGAGLEGVMKIRDGFLIDAPKGCRIQVRDERTGELRRLTFAGNSKVRISLLDKLEAIARSKASREKEADVSPHLSAGKFARWLSNGHVHVLDPQKLKLKADSMAKDFVEMEFGFAPDGLLIATLPSPKKGGLFGGGGKAGSDSREEARSALLEHFRSGKSIEDAPVGEKHWFPSDNLAEMRVIQPSASLTESLFAGIPVFGTGKIAVQLPVLSAGTLPRIASFYLSGFREFVEIIGTMFSMADFGRNLGIPLADTYHDHKCHFSDVTIHAIDHVEFYQADPSMEVETVGWKCESCGLAVSEDARKKEKLGGKAGKGMAKQKCPKCQQKMGSHPLYSLLAKTGSSATPMEPTVETGGAAASTSASATEEKTVEKTVS